MTLFRPLLILIMSLVVNMPALAATNDPRMPAPIEHMASQGAQIRYMGRDLGMDGWLVIQNGQEQYFYSTLDGQAILLGILFNNKGDAMTLQQITRLREKEGSALDRLTSTTPSPLDLPTPPAALAPTESIEKSATNTASVFSPEELKSPEKLMKAVAKTKAEKLFDSAENSNWFTIGQKTAPALYIFFDPECPHCHDLIKDVRKSGFLEQGLVQLRLIPVGVLSENSLIEAAYLLASPDPQKDMFKRLDGDHGALLIDKNANTQGVQKNMKIMQEWGLDVTPFSIYKDRYGKIKVLQGRPGSLKDIVQELR
ncbi:MAG: thioredoxin fold domain-containing protein [Pseudobdellovibrionaceae bacterium]